MNTSIAVEKIGLFTDGDDPLEMSELGLLLFGHAAFQYLYAGCELKVFELLAETPDLSKSSLIESLNLEPHSARCLLFGLTALKLVIKADDTYRNSLVIKKLFTDGQWEMFYDTVLFEARIVYAGQADFVESLRQNRNVGLRQIPGEGPDLYHRLAENPELEKVFYNYMSSWSRLANPLLLKHVDFQRTQSVVDVGGGDGTNAIALAQANPHLKITLLDIPSCCEIARHKVARHDLAERIEICEGNMFLDEFPSGHDCFLFIHQLVIWPLGVNTALLTRAYQALKPGGRGIIFNSMSSDAEDGPVMSALDSVYFICIPAEGGLIYSWKDYEGCLRSAGFEQIERIEGDSWTPHGIIVATK
jgi:ubiquinone/menaquinone biosynthesis C-methylase UbiE